MSNTELNVTDSALELLLTRRSQVAARIVAPGPSPEQLEQIISAGLRVPDHCRAEPWRVQIIESDGRRKLVDLQTELFLKENEPGQDKKLEILNQITIEAPILLVVTAYPNAEKFEKAPLIEQLLSGGALCQNMLLAAHAMGFVAQWITGWRAYHDDIKALLGHKSNVDILGFICIGSADTPPVERPRPSYENIVAHWP